MIYVQIKMTCPLHSHSSEALQEPPKHVMCTVYAFPLDAGDDDAAVDHHMEAVFSHLPEDRGGVGTDVPGAWHQGVEPMGGW